MNTLLDDVENYVLAYFPGASPKSTRIEEMLRYFCNCLSQDFKISGEIPGKVEDLYSVFGQFLEKAALQKALFGKKIILVIDALNKLTRPQEFKHLAWLPQKLPANVKVIVSTLDDVSFLENLGERKISKIVMKKLPKEQREDIIKKYLGKYEKKLTREQLDALLDNEIFATPLFLRIALEELRLNGRYHSILDRIQKFPKNETEFLIQLFNQHGGIGKKVLLLIACSRHGLTESEIRHFIQQEKKITPLKCAQIYESLKPYLMQRDNLHVFLHSIVEKVFREYYLSNGKAKKYHIELAKYFSSASDERKIAEVPHQHLKAGKIKELAEFLCTPAYFDLLTQDWNFEAVTKYWKAANENPYKFYKAAFKNLELEQKQIISLCEKASRVLQSLALYREAIYFLGKALKQCKRRNGKCASIHFSLSMLYMKVAEYKKSKEHAYESLQIHEKFRPRNDYEKQKKSINLAKSYDRLGEVYWQLVNCDKAIKYYKKACEIKERELGTENLSTATTYTKIAKVYSWQLELDKAEQYFKQSIAVRKKILGDNSFAVATNYNDYAKLYLRKHDYDKSLKYCNMALKIRMSQLGEHHPSVAATYTVFASAYLGKGKTKEAREYSHKVLEINKNKLGQNHVHLSLPYRTLGDAYVEEGNYNQAIEFYKKAYKILRKANVKIHDLGYVCLGMAKALYYQEKHGRSHCYIVEGYEIFLKEIPQYPETLECQKWKNKIEEKISSN